MIAPNCDSPPLDPGPAEPCHPFPSAAVASPGSPHRTLPSDEDLAAASRDLEGASPPDIIRWGVETFGDRLTMATAFGPEGCVILHWLAQIAPRTHVFNLETGYQFAETLELRDRIARRYGIEVVLERPETTVEEYERLHGGPLHAVDPDRCCADRKIAVIRRVLAGYDAWMSGIRRDQSADRAIVPIVGLDRKFGVVKVSPLANWTKAMIWDLVIREDIPYNPLHDRGYVSIGCAPCTRPISLGEDERAGRWSGSAKTECGLHSRGS